MRDDSSDEENSAEIEQLKHDKGMLQRKLHRRNVLLDTIKESYLKDVVTVKHELLSAAAASKMLGPS